MCRVENVRSPERASIMEVAAWIATAVFVALMILTLVSGCGPTIRNSLVMIDNKSGTVNVGNKDVKIPVSIPVRVNDE